MSRDDFEQRSVTSWDKTIGEIVGPYAPQTLEWRDPEAMLRVLTPFMGSNNNHTMLPTGGGYDLQSVSASVEPGCLEFAISKGTAYVVKPQRLTLERVEGLPGNSFLLLELDELAASGVYDERDQDEDRDPEYTVAARGREELLETAPGVYADRALWDQGYLDYDENGREIPLPDEARIVTRWLRGKLLFVAKASLWNREGSTYDGRHSRMSAEQIRTIIERSIKAL